MMKYALRSREYENLRAQEHRMRGFVVFAPENGALVSEGIISRKKAGSILGELDEKDEKIYAEITKLEKKYVPYWRANQDDDGKSFAYMLEVHQFTNGFINVFLFMEKEIPYLCKIEKKAGITAAIPLEIILIE